VNRNVLMGIGSIAAVAIAAILILGGSDNSYIVRAELKDAGGLRKNASVKIAGVPAGKVKEVKITKRDTAIAVMRLKKNAVPIGEGASMQVRPSDLLGEHYAALEPGDVSHPLPSNSLIPMTRTGTPVELDDIINILDPDTRTRLGILINELGIGLQGRGFDLNKLLAELPPNLEQARQLLAEVNSQNQTLKQLLVNADVNTVAMNSKRNDLGTLLDEAAGGLKGIADKRRDLGRTIENAPAALRELRATLGQLRSASVSLRPFAGDLQRAAAPLNETLKTLPSFASSATPTLRTATSVAPSLTRLGKQATPTVKRLRPTAKVLAQTLGPAQNILDQLDVRGVDDILYFLENWSKGMKSRDALGHYVSAKVGFDTNTLLSAVESLNAGQPTVNQQTRLRKPALPSLNLPGKGTQQGPVLRLPDKLRKLPKQLVDRVGPQAIQQATDTVTGLLGGGGASKNANGSQPPLLGGLGTKTSLRRHDSGTDALRLFDYLMGP